MTCRVVVASREIIGLTLALKGAYIETRLAHYLHHRLAAAYRNSPASLKSLQALFLFGKDNQVFGQSRKGAKGFVKALNEAFVKTGGRPSSLKESLHWSWQAEGPLSPLKTTVVDVEIAQVPKPPLCL